MAGLSTGTTATTTQAKELCIGCIAFDIGDFTGSPTNSFTEVTERSSGAPDLTVLERIVSATGTYGTTVSWSDGVGFTPIAYSLCGAIATFKSNEVDGSIAISSSAATATLLSVTENHGSSISIGVVNASAVMPNANVQASAQTSASLSTASATAPSLTFSAGTNQNISVSTATAALLTVVENHGSAVRIGIDDSYFFPVLTFMETLDAPAHADATMLTVTPAVSHTLSTFTAAANTPALTANGTANVNLSIMTASAGSKDASAQGDKGTVARRIIISCG